MPCVDGRERDGENRAIRELTARCCSLFTYLEGKGLLDDFYRQHSKDQSGLSSDNMRAWWSDHKRRDAERRSK